MVQEHRRAQGAWHDEQYVPSAHVQEMMDKYPDVAKVFDDEWLQYRKSDILPQLTWETQATCDEINRTFFTDNEHAMKLFHQLVPEAGEGVDIRPPIRLDYGLGLKIGKRTFINMDFLIVGGGAVSIGEDCLIGPRCSIYTPNHAVAAGPRLDGWQNNSDVRIGNNVWFGGNVTVCPGVSIGDNCVIGAGAVVVKSIPANSIAVGNPAHVVGEVPADFPNGTLPVQQ